MGNESVNKLSYLEFLDPRYDEFDPMESYSLGAVVIYNKTLYESVADSNQGNYPANSPNWRAVK